MFFFFASPFCFFIFLFFVLCYLLCFTCVWSYGPYCHTRLAFHFLPAQPIFLFCLTFFLLVLPSYIMLILYFVLTRSLGLCICYGMVSCTTLLGLDIVFVLDLASVLFLFTLIMLSNCVLLYSYYYLSEDSSFSGFFGCLLSFLLSIFGLVLSGSLFSFVVFWDLLGFTSFFLVIWYRSRASVSGGLLTGLINRIGDCFFLIFLGLVFSSIPLTFFLLLFAVALSLTKSAQVPFSSWLPAAIAAPTPVSSLVHSSTLVTAGVYLLYRFVPLNTNFLVRLGIATTLLAGMGAWAESDLKKIVAISTISQLGLIFTSLGLGLKSLTFLHLNLHASSKALLFMSVGLLIHSNYGSQESRLPGSWLSGSYLVPFSISVSCLSMCGMTCLRGWVSKDYILSGFYSTSHSNFVLTSFLGGIIFSVAYSVRLVLLSCRPSLSRVSLVMSRPLPLLVKSALARVLFLVVVQGISINVKSYPLFAVLSSWAFVTLVSSILFGILIAILYSPVDNLALPGFKTIRLCVSLPSYASKYLFFVIPLQSTFTLGSGLGSVPIILTNLGVPSLYLSRICVLLIFCLLV